MKKFLLIISIVVLLALSACKNDETLPDASKLDIGDFNQTIPIYIATEARFAPADNEVSDWELYIKEKYRVSIDLAYIIVDGDSAEFTSNFVPGDNILLYDEFRNIPDKSGLIFCEKYYISFFRESGLITPINEFKQDIDLVKTVNEKVLGEFVDNSGNIWAVPYTDKVNLPTRLYCDEWLKKANMSVPVDLKDFREYAEFLAFNDPDGNGKNDTYIHEFQEGYQLFYSFADVFRAYGCYPGIFSPFSYNPQTEKIENVILNENFPQAIEFIRQMKNDGLLPIGKTEKIGEREPDYYAGSVFSSNIYPEYWDGWQAGYYLIGTNVSALTTPQGGGSGVMVIEGTKNPGEMLNVLGAMAETKSGFLDMYYGREGYNYELLEGYCNIIFEGANKVKRNPIRLFYGSAKSYEGMLKDNIRIVYGKDLSELYTNDITYEDYDSDNTVGSLMNSDVVYMTPGIVQNDRIRELDKLIVSETHMLLYNIMENNGDIEAEIEIYREALGSKGFYEMLEEINAD